MKINKSLSIISSFIFVLIFILVQFPGCSKIENTTNSASVLIVESITGTNLEDEANSTTVFSDVITTSGTVFNDTATALLSGAILNPGQTSGTFYQDITVDQIDIRYTRTDGLNVEGQDVPYSFSQKVYIRVPVAVVRTPVQLSFVLIQHTAKLESPLVELTNLGQEIILKLEAHITFYGTDGAGNRIEPAVGSISVWCSNFNDTN